MTRLRILFVAILLSFGTATVFLMQHRWSLPPLEAPPPRVLVSNFVASSTSECGAATGRGDALMHAYFAQLPTNATLLDLADAAFGQGPASVDVLLRRALLALLRLDRKRCSDNVAQVLALDPLHERAHLISAYCTELGGDIAQSRAAHARTRALDIHGSDRYFSMPGGYGPFLPSDWQLYHRLYMPALAGLFVCTEFMEMGLGGRDRWVSSLLAMQDEPVRSLDEVVSNFATRDYMILRGLLTPYEQSILHTYYDATLRTGILPNHEPFVTSCVNERVGYFLNQRFRPAISAIAEHPLLVTYSYFVDYNSKEGNPGLKAHTDAVDNQVTMSMSITRQPYTPAWIWPLYFQKTPKSPVTELGTWERQLRPGDPDLVEALLNTGDGLLFRGRAHPHFREPLDGNRTYGNVLSHFVHSDYPIWLPRHVHNQRYANDKDLPTRGHEFIR